MTDEETVTGEACADNAEAYAQRPKLRVNTLQETRPSLV